MRVRVEWKAGTRKRAEILGLGQKAKVKSSASTEVI